jgi:hypothetical protein
MEGLHINSRSLAPPPALKSSFCLTGSLRIKGAGRGEAISAIFMEDDHRPVEGGEGVMSGGGAKGRHTTTTLRDGER